MNKVTRLFWPNSNTLAKIILYDTISELVISIEKFDKETNKKTDLHILEKGFLDTGQLTFKQAISFWETEALLSTFPTYPVAPIYPTIPPIPYNPNPPYYYTWTTSTTDIISINPYATTCTNGNLAIIINYIREDQTIY